MLNSEWTFLQMFHLSKISTNENVYFSRSVHNLEWRKLLKDNKLFLYHVISVPQTFDALTF